LYVNEIMATKRLAWIVFLTDVCILDKDKGLFLSAYRLS